MRRAVGCSAALVACGFFAVPALADEIDPSPTGESAPGVEPEPKPEPKPVPQPATPPQQQALREPDWIPSIDVGLEVFDYNVDTTLANHVNPPSWQGDQSEAERQTMFRFGGEVMGPAIETLPGRPRWFAQGGVQIRLWSSDRIFGVGDPFSPLQPERAIQRYENTGPDTDNLPFDFPGQGSDMTAHFQDPSWYAGLGLAFSVPLGKEQLLYIKPSVQYSVEKIDLSGALTTVDEPIPRVDPVPCGGPMEAACVREFFAVRSRANGSTTDHSVGVGLETAVVLFRSVRPIRVALYAEARFMWLVSGSKTAFADSAGVASYSVTRDDFGVKGGGGLRFSWVGFD